MSAADKRVAELLDRWLASVELHVRHLDLDDAAYARAQDWPKHQRPTRWIVELARARLLELQRHLGERQSQGDSSFAESLELMSFLTTLLGTEHVERFIPQAAAKSTPAKAAAPTKATVPAKATSSGRTASPPRAASTSKGAAPAKTAHDPTIKQKVAFRQKPAARANEGAPGRGAPASSAHLDKMMTTVIADAVRFLSWGREWPHLASSITRLAGRPSEQEVWKVLRAHRAAIEAQARRAPD
jgi:hypothetical protein